MIQSFQKIFQISLDRCPASAKRMMVEPVNSSHSCCLAAMSFLSSLTFVKLYSCKIAFKIKSQSIDKFRQLFFCIKDNIVPKHN